MKVDSDAHPQNGETLTANISVVPESEFLLSGIAARENAREDPPNERELAGHYADGVELTLTQLD